ncbi:UNVERIFIED_ORG: hypothetical protein BCL66_12050 [Martelella mediterranea]
MFVVVKADERSKEHHEVLAVFWISDIHVVASTEGTSTLRAIV